MKPIVRATLKPPCGFTLVELLVSMLILGLLALMSYRGLVSVLDTREHVQAEADKWRRVANFFERFESDVGLAVPRTSRWMTDNAPAWRASAVPQPNLEFNRFASVDGVDEARRLAYRYDGRQVELWIWPGVDIAAGASPARYALMTDIAGFELHYMNDDLNWVEAWPGTGTTVIPRAVRVKVQLARGEEVVRIFALRT